MVSISSPDNQLGPLLISEKQRGRLRLSVYDGHLVVQLYVIRNGEEMIVSFSHISVNLPLDIDIDQLVDVI